MAALREGTLDIGAGRRIGWLETGAPDGRPVLVFHGLPGSRRQRHPDASIGERAGARVIHLERPGFGLSTPLRGRGLLDWPSDVAACADALGLARFAIAGISGGGPYALAARHLLAARVTRTAIVSGVGPPGSMAHGMTPLARLGFALAPRWPALLRAVAAPFVRLAMRAPDRYLDHLARQMAPADRPILARPAVRAMFAEDYRAAFAQGMGPFATDLAIIASPWGFTPAAAPGSLAIWHGEADRMVPPSAARTIAAGVPAAELRVQPGEGHFMVFDRWAEILDWLAGE